MKYLVPFVSLALLGFGPQEKRTGEERSGRTPIPEIGMAAPSFRLNDQLGRAVAVGAESEQWTVLAFFPKAASPG